MPKFIDKCNCRGSRPSGVVGLHHNLRSEIVGTMLRDRHVARFLSAPKGYGKSALAYEYAQIMFEFRGVFWIRCTSPCFLRDLDEGSMWEQIQSSDSSVRLVVFDDVPSLDASRTDAFCEVIAEALDAGCEVVVCSVPSVDTFSSSQHDKIVVDGRALLLSDDEVEMERLRGNISKSHDGPMPAHMRVPCSIWSEHGTEMLLQGMKEEELPAEMELAIFSMLVLGSGPLSMLEELMPPARMDESIEYLAGRYPHLGIDADAGAFDAMKAKIPQISLSKAFSMPLVASASLHGDKDRLCAKLAEMLLGIGAHDRACDLMREFASKEACADWARRSGWRLIEAGRPFPLISAIKSATSGYVRLDGALRTMWAYSALILEDRDKAARLAGRVCGQHGSELHDVAASMVLLCSMGIADGGISESLLESALQTWDMVSESEMHDGPAGSDGWDGVFDWKLLLRLEIAIAQGSGATKDAWDGLAARTDGLSLPERNSVLLASAWLLDRELAAAGTEDAEMPAEDAALRGAVELACLLLRDGSRRQEPTWPECLACASLEEWLERHPYRFDCTLAPAMVAKARRMSTSLYEQAGLMRKMADDESRARGEYEITHPDSFRKTRKGTPGETSLRISTPRLNISLFGGLEVWVGDDRQDPRVLRRRNAKTALALFVLSRGREISREKLAEAMWPSARIDRSINNLYVVWAYLRKMLSVGGTCPYLIKSQTGYRLDMRHVATDIDAFERLCKGLLFGRDDASLWEEMFEKVSNDFADDLLPSVEDNDFIVATRDRYRTQLIDGLVAAAGRLGGQGENRGAIWFAREALRRDESREDAYIALMQAQIASSQRGAALDTYFACRRFLTENLGIDPSPKVMELYRSIIETEEEF